VFDDFVDFISLCLKGKGTIIFVLFCFVLFLFVVFHFGSKKILNC